MPWIRAPHEDEWEGDLEELNDTVIDPVHERVDWIKRIHALDAGSMRAHLGIPLEDWIPDEQKPG